MLKNHYLRNMKVGYKTLNGRLNSVVLSYIPNDRLVTKDDIICAVLNSRDKDLFRNSKAVENSMEEIINQGFLTEIVGVKLERALGL